MSQEQIDALKQQIGDLSAGLEAVGSEQGSPLVTDLSAHPGLQTLVEQAASAAIGRERTRTKEIEDSLVQKQEELLALQNSNGNNMDAKQMEELLQKQKEGMDAQFNSMQQQLLATQNQLVREQILRASKIPKDFEQYVLQTGTSDEIKASAANISSLYGKIVTEARTKALTEYGIQPDMTAIDYAAQLEAQREPVPEPQTVNIAGKEFNLTELAIPEELKAYLQSQASLEPEAHGVTPAPQSLPQNQPQSTVAQLGYNQNSQLGTQQPQQPASAQTQMPQNAPQEFGQQAAVGTSTTDINVGAMSTQDYLSKAGSRESAHNKMQQALATMK